MASLVLVRYLDIARLGGTTASGEPASFSDWRQYSWRLLLFALAVWIVAHALGGLDAAITTAMLSGAGVIVWATVHDSRLLLGFAVGVGAWVASGGHLRPSDRL